MDSIGIIGAALTDSLDLNLLSQNYLILFTFKICIYHPLLKGESEENWKYLYN